MRTASNAESLRSNGNATPEEEDWLRAHYLGMSYEDFIARREELREQARLLWDADEDATLH